MVQVSYPGVYIQEVSSGVHAIAGVSTSIGAFFGRSSKGPINRAVRILSRSDFVRVFGGPHPSSDLAASIGKFFDNGGQDCYVVRVAHNATAARVTLRNLAGASVLAAEAKDQGAWANSVRLEVSYNTANPDETFNLRVIPDASAGPPENHQGLSMDPNSPRYAPAFVTQSSSLIRLRPVGATASAADGFSESRRPFTDDAAGQAAALAVANALIHPAPGPGVTPASRFDISVNDTGFVPIDLRANPGDAAFANFAAVASDIQARINAQLGGGATVGVAWQTANGLSSLRITSTSGTGIRSVRIRRSPVQDLAGPLMLGLDQGGIEAVRFAELRPAPSATMYTGSLNTLAATAQNSINRVTVGGRLVDLRRAGANQLETVGGQPQPFFVDNQPSAINGHSDGVREKLRIIGDAINRLPPDPGGNNFRAEIWGYHLAILPTSGNSNNLLGVTTGLVAGGGTDLVASFTANTRQYSMGSSGTGPSQTGGSNGQDDDGNPPDVPDYLGIEADKTGFYALDNVDLFNLMVLPGDRDIGPNQFEQIIGPAAIYCSDRRAFLLLDAPPAWTNAQGLFDVDASKVNALRNLIVKQNTAVFYPNIVYSDQGRRKEMGPSAAIAGIMARIDSTRGVWKAPAGLEADLRAVLDLTINMTDKENGVINKLGANALRKFPAGTVSWGARTLDGSDDTPSEWKYIPIRRFALFLEESLFRGTKWVVFEPNDEPLWANIRKNLRAFMMGLFRQGAFEGSTPDQAFYVKCDDETTTANDRNLGIVNIEVGFAPLKPAEFVVIKIQQIAETE